MKHAPVLILGSGPAGYAASIYAARALRKPLLIAGVQQGGQLSITTDVENYPGYADPVQGPWMMEQMQAQAERLGVEIALDHVDHADLTRRPFHLRGAAEYSCDVLIIATGAVAKWLGLPSEEKYRGYGVSACATCDGFFYRGKDVLVVGGGNTALEEALFLTQFARKVTVVHRRDAFRGEAVLRRRVLEHDRIEVIWNGVVEEIVGDDDPPGVTGVRLRDVTSGAETRMAVDGVFVAIGHAPQTAMFGQQLERDGAGYIRRAPDSTKTNVPGVYAAGDVADPIYRQAVTAAGMGCMAALEAEAFLGSP